MTKRFIGVFLVFIMVICFSSCGSDASDYAKEHGQIAVEIVEDYLAGNLTADAARNKLSVQESLLEKHIDDTEKENNHYPYSDSLVKTYISSCSSAILLHSMGSKSKAYVEEKIKDLRKAIK